MKYTDISLHGTESALRAAVLLDNETGFSPLMALNPGRALDIAAPQQVELSPATVEDLKLITPAQLGHWYISLRINDDGGDPVLPKGLTISPQASSEPGFGVPLVEFRVSPAKVVVLPRDKVEELERQAVALKQT
jgi:hypothetical protein